MSNFWGSLHRDGVFPGGWQRNRDWQKLRKALLRLDDLHILHDGEFWAPFKVEWHGGEAPLLDDRLAIEVAFPSGSKLDGPPIDLAFRGLSNPMYRAFVAVQMIQWIPGLTRVRLPSGQKIWTWSRDPTHYEVLTRADHRRIVTGGARGKYTRQRIDSVFRNLPGVEVIGERVTGRNQRIGWLVVPNAAASAIRRGLSTDV